MKANSTGTKYFPINLQKKSMAYSGSQPQINFTPPIKTLNNSVAKNETMIKIKKDYSNVKYTPDPHQNSINHDPRLKMDYKQQLNLSGKPPSYVQDLLKSDMNNSRNSNLNASYSKYLKIEKELTKERAKNELLSSASQMLNGSQQQDTLKKTLTKNSFQNQGHAQMIKSIQEKNDFLKNSREKSGENSRYFIYGGSKETPPIIKRPSSKMVKVNVDGENDRIMIPAKENQDKEKFQITIKSTSLTKGNTTIKIKTSNAASLTKTYEVTDKDRTLPKNHSEAEFARQFVSKNGSSSSNPKVLKSSSSTFNMMQPSHSNQINSTFNETKTESKSNEPYFDQASTEDVTVKYGGAPLIKKPIKHVHQKSLSDNMNNEVNSNGEGIIGYSINKKVNNMKIDQEQHTKEEEKDVLNNELLLTETQQIKNIIAFSNNFLSLEDSLDQSIIEERVNFLLKEVLAINPDSYECFNKNSKLGLNKILNRSIKYYTLMILLIKFGILEFLLNNMLQKKIKNVIKAVNSFLYDFVDAFIYSVIDKYTSTNNGGGPNPQIQISKEIFTLMSTFASYGKRYNSRVLNVWSCEYQAKIYENKILNQLKVFLDELFSENYYASFHSSVCQLLAKFNLITLDKLITLIDETYVTSLKVKTIASPFDFLAPGKSSGVNNPVIFPNKTSNKCFTLVLDLDETLIHFAYSPSGGSFIVRPHCFEFLKSLSKHYEIIIFTAATQEYANRVINLIDPNNESVMFRLYRQHTVMAGGELVKDLSKLGRDIKKILIIDNIPKNFKLQPLNGLEIKTWTGDISDSHLSDLEKLLTQLAISQPEDVRTVIKSVKQQLGNFQNNNPVYKKIVI